MSWFRDLFISDPVSGTRACVSSDGNQCVVLQDQVSRPIELRFQQPTTAPGTLGADTVVNTYTIDVSSTTGFVDGAFVTITEGAFFFFATQIGAPAGNVITLDSPLDHIFTAAGASVFPGSIDMAVDGSSPAEIFQIGPVGSAIEIDITRLIGSMLGGVAAMDDGKFGNITALANGCILRLSNGVYQNLWNVKTNRDLQLLGYDFAYSGAAPAGNTGCRFRVSYAGQDKRGVAIRLSVGDKLEFIVQDNLSTLVAFNFAAQGHVVED